MRAFQSNEEFFQTVEALIASLELAGNQRAADEVRDGYRCLNGLTDGSALFLESLERVQSTQSDGLSREDRQTLERLRAAVHRAVYRR